MGVVMLCFVSQTASSAHVEPLSEVVLFAVYVGYRWLHDADTLLTMRSDRTCI